MNPASIVLTIVFFLVYSFMSSVLLNKALHDKRNRMATYKELKAQASFKSFLICLPLILAAALISMATKP